MNLVVIILVAQALLIAQIAVCVAAWACLIKIKQRLASIEDRLSIKPALDDTTRFLFR